MPLPHAEQDTGTVAANGHIFVTGGNDGLTVSSTVYSAFVKSDGTISGWTTLTATPMLQPLYSHSAVVGSGRIILSGGVTTGGPNTALSTIYTAIIHSDGSLGAWSTNANSLPAARYQHSAVITDGYYIVVGGYDSTNNPTSTVYSGPLNPDGTVGVLTPISDSLPVPLVSEQVVSSHGIIAVTGGVTAPSLSSVPTVYYGSINQSTGNIGAADCLSNQAQCWNTSYDQLLQPLEEHGALVANGVLIVTGGLNTQLATISNHVYTIPFNVATGTTLTGAPATVAVVFSLNYPNAWSDMNVYRNYYNLPSCSVSNGCFRKVNEVGAICTDSPNDPNCPSPTGDAGEWTEDIEMISATCPNCHILMVEAASSQSLSDMCTTENTAAGYGRSDANFAPIAISNSYAFPEFAGEITAPYNGCFNHSGITITAAAGNGGWCASGGSCHNSNAGPQWPAVDPNVIAVGGTYLTQTRGVYSDAVWNRQGPMQFATSSGCSAYEIKPAWQSDTGCPKRMVEDISAMADGSQDLAHYSVGAWIPGYGTSSSAPIVAAMSALAGEVITPSYLYGHASSLRDVTSYNNISIFYFCNAVSGYDGPSGLGVPSGTSGLGPLPTMSGTCATRTIRGGMAHTVALASDGTVWAYGYNYYGELGNGQSGTNQTGALVPNHVLGVGGSGLLSGISSISAGGNDSIAVASNGFVYDWGLNANGQLGNGTTTDSSKPIQVLAPSGQSGYLSGVIAVSQGNNVSYALKSDGTVWAWGAGSYGALGNGNTTDSSLPVQVLAPQGQSGYLTGVVDITAGSAASTALALKADGTVWGWGYNAYGSLGNGNTTDSAWPVQVLAPTGQRGFLTGVRKLSAANAHALALMSDGTVDSWGYNNYGQLGNNSGGSGSYSSIPVKVVGQGGTGNLSGVVDVSGGSTQSLAVLSSGNVYSWGSNGYGELGINSSDSSVHGSPVEVLGQGGTGFLSSIGAVGAGSASFSLAVDSNGNPWGWGRGFEGQLGNGLITAVNPTPLPPSGLTNVALPGACQ
jgi:alpha-tubulin suppressor-like RCC1 family protein